jgi:hypothetical protein
MNDKVTLDIQQVAKFARNIALEQAKNNPGMVVGPELSWVDASFQFLCVRDALREIEKILDDMTTKAATPSNAEGA